MIKTIVKLVVVALIANASWRIGSAYMSHYKFTDSVHQLSLFSGKQTDDVLRKRIFEARVGLRYSGADETSRCSPRIITRSWTAPTSARSKLAPGFVYPWPFDFHIDTLSGIL